MAACSSHIGSFGPHLCYHRLYSDPQNPPHPLHIPHDIRYGHYHRCSQIVVTQSLQSQQHLESHRYDYQFRYAYWSIQGANQGSIFHWSRDHRLHHKFSDTELDPHTISKGFFFAHCGWLLVKKSPQLIE